MSGDQVKVGPVLPFPQMPSGAGVPSVSGPHWICPPGRMVPSGHTIQSHSHSFSFVGSGGQVPEAWESKADEAQTRGCGHGAGVGWGFLRAEWLLEGGGLEWWGKSWAPAGPEQGGVRLLSSRWAAEAPRCRMHAGLHRGQVSAHLVPFISCQP